MMNPSGLRFAGDTCAALEEFQRDPRNSSLATILPCDDKLTARWALRDTRAGISDLIDQINKNISEVRSSSAFPGLVNVCNPFSAHPEFTYQPENCSAEEIRIGDIPRVRKKPFFSVVLRLFFQSSSEVELIGVVSSTCRS